MGWTAHERRHEAISGLSGGLVMLRRALPGHNTPDI